MFLTTITSMTSQQVNWTSQTTFDQTTFSSVWSWCWM